MERCTTTSTHVHFRVPANSAYLRELRTRLTEWARHRGLSDDATYGLAVATDEATSNVIRHAYPGGGGLLDVQGTTVDCGNGIVVTVTDYGRWKHPTRPAIRRHGLTLIGGFADSSEVMPTRHGTVVRMKWRLRRPSHPAGPPDGQAHCDICTTGSWTGIGFLGRHGGLL